MKNPILSLTALIALIFLLNDAMARSCSSGFVQQVEAATYFQRGLDQQKK